nr:MAG TPA: hypothetical protein [Caudoviricetes sp.]
MCNPVWTSDVILLRHIQRNDAELSVNLLPLFVVFRGELAQRILDSIGIRQTVNLFLPLIPCGAVSDGKKHLVGGIAPIGIRRVKCLCGKLFAKLVVIHDVKPGSLNSLHNVVQSHAVLRKLVFFPKLFALFFRLDEIADLFGAVVVLLVKAAFLHQRPLANADDSRLRLLRNIGSVCRQRIIVFVHSLVIGLCIGLFGRPVPPAVFPLAFQGAVIFGRKHVIRNLKRHLFAVKGFPNVRYAVRSCGFRVPGALPCAKRQQIPSPRPASSLGKFPCVRRYLRQVGSVEKQTGEENSHLVPDARQGDQIRVDFLLASLTERERRIRPHSFRHCLRRSELFSAYRAPRRVRRLHTLLSFRFSHMKVICGSPCFINKKLPRFINFFFFSGGLCLTDGNPVKIQHELAFQPVHIGAKSLGVLDDLHAVFRVNEVRYVSRFFFEHLTGRNSALWPDHIRLALGWDKDKLHLRPQIGDFAALLHGVEFRPTACFFLAVKLHLADRALLGVVFPAFAFWLCFGQSRRRLLCPFLRHFRFVQRFHAARHIFRRLEGKAAHSATCSNGVGSCASENPPPSDLSRIRAFHPTKSMEIDPTMPWRFLATINSIS